MINFLPPAQKKELLEEERFKIVLILGIVGIAVFISLFLILLAVKIFLSSQLEIHEIILTEKEKEMETAQVKEIEGKIKTFNLNFSKLKSFYQEQSNFSKILKEVSRTLPAGVYITSFSFSSGKISLTGFCPDRERLLELRENLEKKASFKEINFPPSNWLRKTDIDFTVNFVYSQL